MWVLVCVVLMCCIRWVLILIGVMVGWGRLLGMLVWIVMWMNCVLLFVVVSVVLSMLSVLFLIVDV